MGGRSSKVSVYVIHAKSDDNKSSSLTVNSNSIATFEKERKSTSDRRRSSSKTVHMKTPPDSPVISTNKKGLGKVMKHSYQRTSEHFPWLLKSANFHNMTLGDFEFGRIIGRGLMGTVRLVKTKNDKYVVFKSMRKDSVRKHNDQRHVLGEKVVLNTMNCVFCIKLFGTFQDKNCLYFALEFAPGGELFQRLDRKKFFPPDVAQFYISEVFIALEHVQSLGFVYRDLKPENVLLDEEGHCKLVDFGFTTAANTESGKLHTFCGTPAYLSPEQLDGKFTNGYTKIVDWWSFGVLLYELRTGRTPFCRRPSDSHYEIYLRVLRRRISFPWAFDRPSRDLIAALCHPALDKRLCDPQDIRRDRYFTHQSWDAVAARRLVPPFVPRIKDVGDTHYFDKYSEAGDGAPAQASGSDQSDRAASTSERRANDFIDF